MIRLSLSPLNSLEINLLDLRKFIFVLSVMNLIEDSFSIPFLIPKRFLGLAN